MRADIINYAVPDSMKRVFAAGGKSKVTRGVLKFPDVVCPRCGGDWASRPPEEPVTDHRSGGADGGPVRCRHCENYGCEWVSWIRSTDDVARVASALTGIDLPRDPRLHLSVGHRERLPAWEELTTARDRLLPQDRHFVMAFPPREYWLNLNEFVLHFHEVHDRTLTLSWEAQRYDGPTLQQDADAAEAVMPEPLRQMRQDLRRGRR
jgi:hypothetical protein